MATCCIVGCDNKVERRGKVKCYNIPTAWSSRQFNVRRRKLWLEAIERANGTTEGLREDAVVCSEHFVSGQISLDVSDRDFVPSVFPKEHLETSRRRTLRPRSGGLSETPKVTPKKRPVRSARLENANHSNHVLPENNYCEPLEGEEVLEEEEVTSQPLVKEDATLPPEEEEGGKEEGGKEEGGKEEGGKEEGGKEEGEKEEGGKEEEEKVTTQPLSSEKIKEFVNLKIAKLEIKSLIDSLGRFQCDVCDGKFPSISALVKHKRLHEEEWSEGEGSEEEWSDGEWFEEEGSEEEGSEEEEIAPTVSEFLIKNEYTDELLSAPVSAKVEFQCNVCHRFFPTTQSLKRHKILHVRDPRKCRQCGTMFCKRHNHVIEHPQISTETKFQEAGIEGDSSSMSETDSSSDNMDEDLKLLLRSDSAALEAIAAQSEAPAEVHKEAPAITYSPRKPGLLTAFKSFLSKKQFKVKTEGVTNCAQNTEVIQSNVMTSTAPKTTIAITAPSTAPSTAPVSPQNNRTEAPCPDTPAAVSPVAISTTNIIAMPEQSSKIHALTTSTNASTCQLANRVVYVTQKQNVGTVHLAFAQPLVLQEYMPCFSKADTGRSAATPQVVKREVLETNELPADHRTILLKPTQIQKNPTFVIPSQPVVNPKKARRVLKIATSRKHSYLPQFKSNVMVPLPSLKPLKHPYEHGSRPPSPEPILTKAMKGPWDSPALNYPKDFIQPHLPQTPELPPELRMFSSQLLTSTWLDVKRNFDYILQK
ncbi:unnamed protein product [Knipowitschia caucasica]